MCGRELANRTGRERWQGSSLQSGGMVSGCHYLSKYYVTDMVAYHLIFTPSNRAIVTLFCRGDNEKREMFNNLAKLHKSQN